MSSRFSSSLLFYTKASFYNTPLPPIPSSSTKDNFLMAIFRKMLPRMVMP
ncbi:hypothetical protein SOVF_067360 isoform A [Spinacia oleracea]|nr:hypothetical protein SOVF_067360 isoform A [Spinacia oleracea]